jgi:CheY-like chemotaxis protein
MNRRKPPETRYESLRLTAPALVSKSDADTLVLILRQTGFEAAAAYNGENAVEAETSFMPDVLIMDVFMEGMNGIECSLQISAILPVCRVILFSGNTETAELLQEAEAHGHFFEILAKPVHPSDLVDRLSAPFISVAPKAALPISALPATT